MNVGGPEEQGIDMRKPLVALGLAGCSLLGPAVAAGSPAWAGSEDPMVASRTVVTAESVSSSPAAPFQQQVLALVNHNRRKAGCGPLTLDARLILAANRHAADMARREYFEHESPGGRDPGERVTGAGYSWSRYSENIARGQASPYQVVSAWMGSPGHRKNILDCALDEMGTGLAVSSNRTPYWVQDFASPL
ncbi:MAG TPA: CAP domain-containing protein [Actinoplanes sp.]|nr:CAP domain-containing protein [Actinoplanes sp.]